MHRQTKITDMAQTQIEKDKAEVLQSITDAVAKLKALKTDLEAVHATAKTVNNFVQEKYESFEERMDYNDFDEAPPINRGCNIFENIYTELLYDKIGNVVSYVDGQIGELETHHKEISKTYFHEPTDEPAENWYDEYVREEMKHLRD